MKRTIAKIFFYLSLIATLVFIFSGYGYQWDIWSMGMGFTLLRYGAYAAIGLVITQVIALFIVKDAGAKAISFLIIGILLTGAVSGTALYWQNKAQGVPPIHDITTNLNNPPEFVAMVRLREDSPNPPEYAGEETAAAQEEAYPHIQPLIVTTGKQEVIDEIVMLIVSRNWDMVSINREDGRVEATEKLPWFGFKDDVVLRVTEIEEGTQTRVDMRSKSRIGRSDIGVNADRIEAFMNDLESNLE